MYSDDDLQDENHALFHTRYGEPEMRPFELCEDETRRHYTFSLREKTPEGDEVDPSKITQAIEWMRTWRVRRFFKTVQGFYTGNLDLSGRHVSRLSEVLPRWTAYISNFLDLSVCARGFEMLVLYGGEEFTVTDYKFDKPEIWEIFRTTWKVPSFIDYGFLFRETQQTLRIIAASSGIPQVQKLCLIDLPSEILDKICSYTTECQIRLLFSTCRRLHELGSRHLSRRIILKRPFSFYVDLDSSDLPLDEYIATAALNARKDTLAFCDFLENRRELLDRMENLMVADRWVDLFDQTIIHDRFVSQLDGGKFHKPLYKSLQKIIASSVNLTVLTFSELKLGLNLIICVCNLPKLDNLNLRMCTISKQARRALLLDTESALVSPVRDLQLIIRSEESLWYAMLFCPRLRNFTVHPFSNAVFPPPEVIWDKCRFFNTLKCLYLGRLALSRLQTFVEWIQQCSHGNTPCLTHLKIEVELGMTDLSIISFLRAVQDAPLEVLSIDGALQANFHLFDWIAQHFPHLLGLTIIRHSSTRSRRSRFVVWPFPVWQYAQRLSAFSRLQHFGWNNEKLVPEYSTYSLRFLEEGALDPRDFIGREEADENECFSREDIDIWTPKLFAIHCPTLRTLTLTFMFVTYRILRLSEGIIEIEDDPRSVIYREKWNPSSFFGHWPLATRQMEGEI